MIDVQETEEFSVWLGKVRDPIAKAKIASRLRRLQLGNFGDTRSLGEGLHELRIDQGPGYRVYYTNRNETLVLISAGGDKDTQAADIANARNLMKDLD